MGKIFGTLLISIIAVLYGCGPGKDIISVDNEEFAGTVSDTATVILIDVRTPEEYAAGHIPGAVNIDVKSPDFKDRISSLDKSKTAAVYCRSGVRSMNAAKILAGNGFKVCNLQNGILGWNGPVTGPCPDKQ